MYGRDHPEPGAGQTGTGEDAVLDTECLMGLGTLDDRLLILEDPEKRMTSGVTVLCAS